MNNRNKYIVKILIAIGIVLSTLVIGVNIKENIEINKSFNEVIRELDIYIDGRINMGINEKFDIDIVVDKLEEKKRYSEIYTLSGIENFKNGNITLAEKNLQMALENKDNKTNYIAEFYIYKYLFKINKIEEDYESAKVNIIKAVKVIPKRSYNRNYEYIGELLKGTLKIDSLRTLSIDIIERILSQKKYISDNVELYLRERIRSMYMLSNRYADETINLIESINIANKIDDNFTLADSMISLAVVFIESGGEESAEKLINDSLNITIDDKYKDAIVKTYGYLNLAQLEDLFLNKSIEAIEILSNIYRYRDYFNDEDFRDIEILKLIYEANAYINLSELTLAHEKLEEASKLLKADKEQYYLNKDLEFYSTYAKYCYAKGDWEEALKVYKYVLKESRDSEFKELEKNILKQLILLTSDMKYYDENSYYTEELIDLNKEIESLRYYDYTTYIDNSMKATLEIQYRYKQYILSSRIGYVSIIIMLLLYMKVIKVKTMSQYDGLTNIYNRKKFNSDYRRLLKKNRDFACIIMDIDDFKKINDTYGHKVGDIVLKNTSKKIVGLLTKNCNVYRYGGEELVVLLKYDDRFEVMNLAEEIRSNIEQMVWREKITVTVSIGVAFSEYEKEKVLEVSDENLYKAKNSGKNKVITNV